MKFFKVFLAFIFVFGAAKAFTINCDYQRWFVPHIEWTYFCDTTNIPTSSGNRVTGVTGQHLDENTNDDVGFIVFYGNWTLSFVPQGISDFFPNIIGIAIGQTTLETLRGDEFDEFPQLQWLEFGNSNLTTISSRLFERTPNMIYINFFNTSLERVGHDLFTPLNIAQLKSVFFSDNFCINQFAHTEEEISRLINDLRVQCPFDDEGSLTCSEKRIEDLVCDLKDEMEKIQENLTIVKEETRNDIENLQNELSRTRNEIQSANDKIKELENEQNKANEKIESQQIELTQVRRELQQKDQKIEEFESRILWLEEEVIRMVVNPCC